MEIWGFFFKEYIQEWMLLFLIDMVGLYVGYLIFYSWIGLLIIFKKREKCGYIICLIYMYVSICIKYR